MRIPGFSPFLRACVKLIFSAVSWFLVPLAVNTLSNRLPMDVLQKRLLDLVEQWPRDVEFITTVVPHSSLQEEISSEFETFLLGCTCSPKADMPAQRTDCCGRTLSGSESRNLCVCLQRSPCPYDDHGLLIPEYVASSTRPAIIECGSLCGCRENAENSAKDGDTFAHGASQDWAGSCRNQVIGNAEMSQKRYLAGADLDNGSLSVWFSLEVFCAERQGLGLRCRKIIVAGCFVCEYAGEMISSEEAKKRIDGAGDTYLFVIREQSHTSSAPGGKGDKENGDGVVIEQSVALLTCIDARHKGNWGRFINHSCQPNLIMLPVRVDTIIPRLAFFARQDIPALQELTVDYNQGMELDRASSSSVNETKASDRRGYSRTVCCCGSINCRGFLPHNSGVFA